MMLMAVMMMIVMTMMMVSRWYAKYRNGKDEGLDSGLLLFQGTDHSVSDSKVEHTCCAPSPQHHFLCWFIESCFPGSETEVCM